MPRPRKNKLVRERHFSWILSRRGGVWWADGRSHNAINAGRHSLGTKVIEEALRLLQRLDSTVTGYMGLVQFAANRQGQFVARDRRQLFGFGHFVRDGPRVAGGTNKTTQTRYRPVLNKFFEFLAKRVITHWNGVTVKVLVAYLKISKRSARRTGRVTWRSTSSNKSSRS